MGGQRRWPASPAAWSRLRPLVLVTAASQAGASLLVGSGSSPAWEPRAMLEFWGGGAVLPREPRAEAEARINFTAYMEKVRSDAGALPIQARVNLTASKEKVKSAVVQGKAARASPRAPVAMADPLPAFSRAAKAARVLLRGHRSAAAGAQEKSHGQKEAAPETVTWQEGEGPPRLFLLFMTANGFNRPELWEAFLEGADPSRYRTFMHCKHQGVCEMALSENGESARHRLSFSLVDTVPSTYCVDLVNPMVQLLQAALQESRSPGDKFVFLSESTIPVKPFSVVYEALTANRDSDFCINPQGHWGQVEDTLIVKHSQWIVLNPDHASAMVDRWPKLRDDLGGGPGHDLWRVPVFNSTATVRTLQKTDLPKCLDEWAPFALVYGAIPNHAWTTLRLPGFGPRPLWLSDVVSEEQGVCRTFAFWRTYDGEAGGVALEALEDAPKTKLSCYPKCRGSDPAEFVAISDHGAQVLRRSRFLFARKFPSRILEWDPLVPSESQFRRVLLEQEDPA